LCHGKALHAAAKLFMLRQSSSCRGKCRHAAAKLLVPWQQNDAMALSGIILRVAAHVAARNEAFRAQKNDAAAFRSVLHHAALLFIVPRPSLFCRGEFLCATARNNVLQHFASSLSVALKGGIGKL